MVRPNSVANIDLDRNEIQFTIPAQTEEQAARRAVILNFPERFLSIPDSPLANVKSITEPVSEVEVISEGLIDRHLVTVDLTKI